MLESMRRALGNMNKLVRTIRARKDQQDMSNLSTVPEELQAIKNRVRLVLVMLVFVLVLVLGSVLVVVLVFVLVLVLILVLVLE